ncbi:unnamed protein product [Didymodactylos carnosus]|uniref:C2H2-type domain-containing protein n=1 Tax=Didymodactylos carnosus TaxID=1234261 RepID=A0A814A8Q0_9BILA|nr:unnamed protein product [Didymodactylos carnosus]CAF1237227.1 unnamed protein product [Didymodactylos carnosus]CAF3692470.1 unnamed protein product [Didymodactylos carnosus]CAF4044865.1 unnamed protein product [Didymodactylos carnosus]
MSESLKHLISNNNNNNTRDSNMHIEHNDHYLPSSQPWRDTMQQDLFNHHHTGSLISSWRDREQQSFTDLHDSLRMLPPTFYEPPGHHLAHYDSSSLTVPSSTSCYASTSDPLDPLSQHHYPYGSYGHHSSIKPEPPPSSAASSTSIALPTPMNVNVSMNFNSHSVQYTGYPAPFSFTNPTTSSLPYEQFYRHHHHHYDHPTDVKHSFLQQSAADATKQMLLSASVGVGCDYKDISKFCELFPTTEKRGPWIPSQKSSKVTEGRINRCRICGKIYARPSTLKTHMRTHSGEKPYKCDKCCKAFTQAANLTAHLRTHSGEKPFSCDICHRKFSQSSSVTTHMRTHSGERPYQCRYCRKAFSDSSTLTKHTRVHSGEKPYTCDLCHLRFSQSGNLNRHMRIHNSQTKN